MMRWGLITYWARDKSVAYKTINARAETIATAPAFRAAWRARRCLVPATGFYEWQKLPGDAGKQPWLIGLGNNGPFAFAGLWETWRDREADESIESYTIITTAPNELCAPIHNRMPVILDPDDYDAWLEASEPPAQLLRPFPAERMRAVKVGSRVNNTRNDDARCVEPMAAA